MPMLKFKLLTRHQRVRTSDGDAEEKTDAPDSRSRGSGLANGRHLASTNHTIIALSLAHGAEANHVMTSRLCDKLSSAQLFNLLPSPTTSISHTMSSNPAAAPSVALPPRDSQVKTNKPPVWPIEASATPDATPLAAKCARDSRTDGVCCKELKNDDRHLIDPDVVRDV